ncbi:MAG: YnfC family lipoprotein [Kluyvera cryocrescens]|uniref:YnfC family lipoprotein n=1 Tax=Kluyvera cryocrescens TaxID=580 RepID=UPI001A35281E|nr:YnfC family lipoprotein [Kluyvera cryocrescens]MDU5687274.1 YnfC family lipoprotein [Kluyvera cryocrescens]MEB7712552.1 YnfC family lipoprotein [Kluyvera cryocrescens]HAT1572876.1 YnfC family lipoprotein [Kluyvera cryocrescens]HDG1672069.1 YnfC family lipoprotein [Kluyvera cryocrescens]
MKKLILLASALTLLSGCDNHDSPAAFTPEMASFSNEFDFDPLRGPVKDFSQTLINEKGEVAKRVSAQISREGCFDLLEFHNIEEDTGALLVLDANYYLDGVTREKRVRLQGKCQLAEFPSAGVAWETDDNGFVVKALSKESEVDYRYDDEGYPLGKTSTVKDNTLSVVSTPSQDVRKKLDYTAVSLLNKLPVTNVTQRCEYDRHDNPVSCELKIVDASAKPPVTQHYTIKNTIEYY